ncbi:MAG: DUF835 domain-containing protein [Thermoplasmata archaeon]|nr:DUF835 domain-containing protein [Thermoplasmata archaeon]
MGENSEFSRGYIKGYKEGLYDAWEELSKLTGRGYTPRELQIMVKSGKIVLDKKIQDKIAEIEKALGRKLFTEESEEARKLIPMNIELNPGTSILIREERPEKAPNIVRSLIASGSRLLSISRMHPDQLKARFDIKGSMIWLTKSELSEADSEESEIEFISPNNLPVLAEAIQQFLSNHSGGVIFLEGLEYMCSQNDFKSVLRFIQLINEQVLLRKGFLVLSVNPFTMDQRDFSLIEREITQVN